MTIRQWTRMGMALALLAFVLWSAATAPSLTRQTAEYAIALWWNHLVPILLPGYVLAEAVIALIPVRSAWMLALLALLTFPPLVGVVLLDWSRQHPKSFQHILPLLLYTNLYNPLLFPHPRTGVEVDIALFLAANLLYPIWRMPPIHWPETPIRPRQWILDGMNWTTILGAVVVLAWLFHRWVPSLGLGWLIDPVGLHWASASAVPLPVLFWTAFGGLAYWIPLLLSWRRITPGWARLVIYRLLQSGLAAGLAAGLGALIR